MNARSVKRTKKIRKERRKAELSLWKKITDEVIARSRQKTKQKGIHPFILAVHPKGVVPEDDKRTMAMDDQITESLKWAQISVSSAFEEGLTFLGYAYLAELAQRPEYRRPCETLATEMTRKWIRFKAADDKDKTDKIKQLEKRMDELDVRDIFQRAALQDGFFGRSHLYIDTDDTDDRDELKTPIGNGRDTLSKSKVNRENPVRRLKTVEAVWCYPTGYNSNDPLKQQWYRPDSWFVMGKEIHSSRFLTFIGREVSDLLKPAYSFGGLSLLQMLKPYVDNWLRTRQSVSDIINAYSVMVLMTNLSESLSDGGEQLFKRAELFNNLRDNKGLMLVDKENEEFKNVSASLSGLDILQAQTQEHMAAVVGIPLVKLLGIQPQGLNADSEGVMRSFYDWIAAYQEHLFRENLNRVVGFVMLSLWDEVDPDILWEFEPIREMNETEESTRNKTEGDNDANLIDHGILDPKEVRRKMAADRNSPYHGIDAEDVPQPPEGPEPGNVTEQEREEDIDEENGGGEGRDAFPFAWDGWSEKDHPRGQPEPGYDQAWDDGEFKESDHPRDKFGKFTSYGVGSALKGSLSEHGFVKQKQGGKQGTVKLEFHHPQHGKVVVEPPQAGAGQSSNFTHYHPSNPSGVQGSGSHSFKHMMQKYSKGSPQPALTQAMSKPEPVKPAEQQPAQTKKLKYMSGFQEPIHSLAIANGWQVHDSDKEANFYKKGNDYLVVQGDGSWNIGVKQGNGPEELKKVLGSHGVKNSAVGVAENEGYKLSDIPPSGDVIYKKGDAKLTIKLDGTWISESPGHLSKTGKGSEALNSLFHDKPGPEGWGKHGITNYTAPMDPAQQLQQQVKIEMTAQAKAKIKQLSQHAPQPTPDEESAIKSYTGSAYVSMNEKLRQGEHLTPAAKKFKEWLDRAEIPEDLTVWRGVNSHYANVLKSIATEGMVFVERGFMSTSIREDFSSSWGGGGLLMKVNVKKGAKGASVKHLSHHSSEDEIVFQVGSKLKVISYDFQAKKMEVELINE